MSPPLLELDRLTKRFGGLAAVDEVSLTIHEAQVHAIVGPNGAGKTTLFNLVSGFMRVDGGRVLLRGQDITHRSVAARVPLGIVRTFQNIRLFHALTVAENVTIGQQGRSQPGLSSLWPGPTRRGRERQVRTQEIIESLSLSAYASHRAAGLPYGVQKRLELARAVAADPAVLLLDEPTAGMNDEESADIMEHIDALRVRGMTVMLVEHDMNVVMGVSDTVSVLDFGKLIASGSPTEIQQDPAVRSAYLGSSDDWPARGVSP